MCNAQLWSTGLIPFATFAAAAAACAVVWVQTRVAKKSLRLGLYKRRLDIYDAYQRLLQACTTNMDRVDDETENLTRVAVINFLRDTSESTFLFRKPMREYIDGIRVLALNLKRITRERHKADLMNDDKRRAALNDEDEPIIKQLLAYDSGMREKFAEYLDFSDD